VLAFVDRTRVVDAATVEISFSAPAPRFVMQLAYWYDMGIYIVPKHVFAAQSDWTQFNHYDPEKGWPLTTGPWRLGLTTPQRTDTFTRPGAEPACRRAVGLPQFVTVKGGAYFFLPGLAALKWIASG